MRLVEAEFFHAEEQTGMTKLIVAFRNFANALKMASRGKIIFIFGFFVATAPRTETGSQKCST
jgi:hypothetical protein